MPLAGRRRTVSGDGRVLSRSGGALVLVALAGVLAAAGCRKESPYFCCSTQASCEEFPGTPITACTEDPARMYCDDEGRFGPRHTCIENPGNADASVAADASPITGADDERPASTGVVP